jgi:hypothetical protein
VRSELRGARILLFRCPSKRRHDSCTRLHYSTPVFSYLVCRRSDPGKLRPDNDFYPKLAHFPTLSYHHGPIACHPCFCPLFAQRPDCAHHRCNQRSVHASFQHYRCIFLASQLGRLFINSVLFFISSSVVIFFFLNPGPILFRHWRRMRHSARRGRSFRLPGSAPTFRKHTP